MEKENKHIKLDELEKKATYQVPDEYFERLPYAIQEKIHTNNTLWEKFSELPPLLKWVSASLVVLLVAYFIWSNPTSETPSFDDLLAEVTEEEILEYIYSEDFSTYEILSNIDKNDSLILDKITTENWLDDLSDDELENILNYYDYDTSIQYY